MSSMIIWRSTEPSKCTGKLFWLLIFWTQATLHLRSKECINQHLRKYYRKLQNQNVFFCFVFWLSKKLKFLWLEFGSIEDVQLDFKKTAWGGKNWPVRLQKHIETKFKFYIFLSVCLFWVCLDYATLEWIVLPLKIALVWLYLFYQTQEIYVFLNSLFLLQVEQIGWHQKAFMEYSYW